jgi:hypothetical protein
VFELTVPANAKVNEAFDVTVKALKADGSVNTAYVGSISFSVTPYMAGSKIPANLDLDPVPDPSDPSKNLGEYTFLLAEPGQHPFSAGFSFPQAGTYEITVMDNETFEEVVKSVVVSGSGGDIT